MPSGNCYEVHVRFLRDELDAAEANDWLLCHGTVTNAAGSAVGHCWLEHNGMAYDFSNDNSFEFPIEEFREITKARDITAYTSQEVSVNIIRHGHYGPWE